MNAAIVVFILVLLLPDFLGIEFSNKAIGNFRFK